MNAISNTLGDAFMLGQFRTFYALLVEHKRHANTTASPLSALDEITDNEEGASLDSSAVSISNELVELLERGAKDAAIRGGSYGSSLYREAEYVMAAMADDVFLNSTQWEGQSTWENNLLEARLFDSYVAGERIFDKIDELLATNSRASAELAAIYLEALTLGFRGKFHGTDDKGALETYRRRLFKLITQRNLNEARDTPIFAQAYAHTLDQGSSRKLPYVRKWVWMLVLFFVLFLGASHILWSAMIADIETVIESVAN